ncbi:MAG: molybdopterin molybdotransferase MoeA [Planctomycetes bacterium]|nr:molybdopterin molybdotransferase MoeA [Planctomycetota bacterium]
MLTVEQALELIAQHSKPLAPVRVPLGEAFGLVLAEDVRSDIDSPPYDKAMMDGYAVVSSDRNPVRQVLEEVAAGAVPHHAVVPGTATSIMTGAPLPEGADAVVPIERTELIDVGSVRLHQVDPNPGQHVLPLGASLRAGETVLREGALLRPLDIAILAEFGHAVVAVRPQPRVAVLPTGNELVPVGEKPAAGQIRNSNGPLLLAALRQVGAEAIDLGIARDDRDDLRRRIGQGLAANMVLLSGGVSAGKFDLVPEVLAELGVEQVLHKVALRPGKPFWFGVRRQPDHNVLVFGLPGNPVSSFVCFELFVRPAMAALAGRGFVHPRSVTARLSHAYDHPGGRAACLPARVADSGLADAAEHCLPSSRAGYGLTVEILPWKGSADLAALARANSLARLPTEAQHFEPGMLVEVLLV